MARRCPDGRQPAGQQAWRRLRGDVAARARLSVSGLSRSSAAMSSTSAAHWPSPRWISADCGGRRRPRGKLTSDRIAASTARPGAHRARSGERAGAARRPPPPTHHHGLAVLLCHPHQQPKVEVEESAVGPQQQVAAAAGRQGGAKVRRSVRHLSRVKRRRCAAHAPVPGWPGPSGRSAHLWGSPCMHPVTSSWLSEHWMPMRTSCRICGRMPGSWRRASSCERGGAGRAGVSSSRAHALA